jgi:hypothetical protein
VILIILDDRFHNRTNPKTDRKDKRRMYTAFLHGTRQKSQFPTAHWNDLSIHFIYTSDRSYLFHYSYYYIHFHAHGLWDEFFSSNLVLSA